MSQTSDDSFLARKTYDAVIALQALTRGQAGEQRDLPPGASIPPKVLEAKIPPPGPSHNFSMKNRIYLLSSFKGNKNNKTA